MFTERIKIEIASCFQATAHEVLNKLYCLIIAINF